MPAADAAVIVGTPKADQITASPFPDVIYAGSGDDTVNNVGNGDIVLGGSGRDTIQLQLLAVSGATIDGNVGNDTIRTLTGGRLDDSSIEGGSGDDRITVRGCRNNVRGNTGRDVYENLEVCALPGGTVHMGPGADTLNAFSAAAIWGGNGNDNLRTRWPGSLHAGSGNDIVRFDLGGNAEVFLGAGNDDLSLSSSTNTKVYGNSGQDYVHGRPSNSSIDTQSGEDLIELEHHARGNALDGGGNRDVARLDATNTGTTCRSLEKILGPDGNPRRC